MLRPLLAQELVAIERGHVELTARGRELVPAGNHGNDSASDAKLNASQSAMLRDVIRQGGKISAQQLDGRIAQALARRGFLQFDSDTAAVTDAGRQWASSSSSTKSTRRRRGAGSGRAAAIHRAVAMLETAIPPDAEVLVGPMMAAAHDIVEGYRKHARKLERSGPIEP